MRVAKFENGRIVIMWASMLVTTHATLACGLANRECLEMVTNPLSRLIFFFTIMVLVVGGHVAFLDPVMLATTSTGHIVGWAVAVVAVVVLAMAWPYVFGRSMMDNKHGAPERGHGPDDAVAQMIGGHGHGSSRSHRTFGAAGDGRIAALASMMRGLVTRVTDLSHFSLTRGATA